MKVVLYGRNAVACNETREEDTACRCVDGSGGLAAVSREFGVVDGEAVCGHNMMRRAPGLFRPHHAKARCILHLSTKGCSNTRKVEAPAGSTTSTCASPSGSTCSASSGTKGSQAADLHVSTAAFWLSAPDVWRRACLNTTRCLIGCSVGDLTHCGFCRLMRRNSSPLLSPHHASPASRLQCVLRRWCCA